MLGKSCNKSKTAEDAIRATGLDFDVELRPLYVVGGDGAYQQVPERYGIYRSDNGRFLDGLVSERYNPLQNREAFTFMDELVQQGLASYESGGTRSEGQRVWVSVRMEDSYEVVKGDKHQQYMILSNSHDGNSSVCVTLTSVRVFCSNQLRMVFSRSPHTIQIRHTSSMKSALSEAQILLKEAVGHFEKTRDFLKESAKMKLKDTDFNEIMIPVLMGKKEVPETLPKQTLERLESIRTLYHNGKGQNFSGVSNTAYALINAVTEFDTHHKTVRNAEGFEEEKRSQEIWFGHPLQDRLINTIRDRME